MSIEFSSVGTFLDGTGTPKAPKRQQCTHPAERGGTLDEQLLTKHCYVTFDPSVPVQGHIC